MSHRIRILCYYLLKRKTSEEKMVDAVAFCIFCNYVIAINKLHRILKGVF